MLRRKLILGLGPLILMVMGAAIAATLLFDAAIGDLSDLREAALDQSAEMVELNRRLGRTQAALFHIEDEPAPLLRILEADSGPLEANLAKEQSNQDAPDPSQAQAGTRAPVGLPGRYATLATQLAAADAATDPAIRRKHAAAALDTTFTLREDLGNLQDSWNAEFDHEYQALMGRLRWWALGLGLAFLLVINLSLVFLIRMAIMILHPVDQLIEANHHLALEEFDYRVPVDREDEFGELARATNALAEQLQQNEARRLEVLHQIGRTLNHELNNAISTIDLQLTLVARRSGSVWDQENHVRLRQIHETLKKMSNTLARLPRIRRVVLTDYLGGVKMLDLQRSTESEIGSGDVGSRVSL